MCDEPLPTDRWPIVDEDLLWRSDALQPLTPAVVARLGNFDAVFLMARYKAGTADEGVQVVSLDAGEGEIRWQLPLPIYLCDRQAVGSVQGVTLDPTTHDLAVLTPAGWLGWVDGVTGGVSWWRSLREEFGWRAAASHAAYGPLVDEALVLVSGVSSDVVGRQWLTVWAFDKRNGELVWQRRLDQTADGMPPTEPVVMVAGDQRTLLLSGAARLYALQVRTGRILWTQSLLASSEGGDSPGRSNNVGQNQQRPCAPVAWGSFVVAGCARRGPDGELTGQLLALDASMLDASGSPSLLWRLDAPVSRCLPLIADGRVYAVDDLGTLMAVELQTGRILGRWQLGATGVGSLIFAAHQLVVCTAAGQWFVFEPTETGLKKVAQTDLPARPVGPPLVSYGRAFLVTTRGVECVGRPDMRLPPTSPPWLVEPPVSDDPEPKVVQVVPAERWLWSGAAEQQGERLPLQIRLFNGRGQFLRLADPGKTVRLQLHGPGRLVPPAMYVSPDQPTHGAAAVTARLLGTVSAETEQTPASQAISSSVARIGLVPRLPWHFDFADGHVPTSWSVVRDRMWWEREGQPGRLPPAPIVVPTDESGRALLVTDRAAPNGVFECFFGPADLSDYTVGCDVLVMSLPQGGSNQSRSATDSGVEEEAPSHAKKPAAQPEKKGLSRELNAGLDAGSEQEPAPLTSAADVGVVAGVIGQRYRLELRGNGQLATVSWTAVGSKIHAVPFSWRSGVWYRLKLRTSVEQLSGGATAVVQAKVWRRDRPEPPDWQLVWKDRPANAYGSPGVFARPDGCQVYFDNVFVIPNSDEGGGK